MITIRTGSHSSHAQQLLQILSVAGEFPTKSLALLGSERTIKTLVHRLESVQDIRMDKSSASHTVKLLQISGKRDSRTIRLYKGALSLLDELHAGALEYYLGAFSGHKFPGDAFHSWRNHRVAEALALCMMAGVEIRQYVLPPLQNKRDRLTVPDFPSFYIARDFKKLIKDDLNKTRYTRIVGALFYPGGCYSVYNARDAVMKWGGDGEIKTADHLMQLTRMNAGLEGMPPAMLFGSSPDIALQTLLASDTSRRMEKRFDKVYQRIHFVPLNPDGIRLVRLLTLPDWKEKILSMVFDPCMRPRGYGFMEYDAYWDGKYIYSHLDSDIARLIRFHEALEKQDQTFEVLCFPWQTGFLRAYLGQRVRLMQIEMGALEAELGISTLIREEGSKEVNLIGQKIN